MMQKQAPTKAEVRAVRLDVVSLVLLIAAAPALASHDKTDVVTTDDGITYIGDIKKVQYATVNLDTKAAGLLSIAWRHVTGLTSKFQYQIELRGGVRHFGSLGPPEEPGHLSIVGPSGPIEVDLAEIVWMIPVEHGFWKRLDGSVNFGLTYTQASDSLQYNLGGDATYYSRKTIASLAGQSIFNTHAEGESTGQHNLKFILTQIARKKWGTFELGQLQSNPSQGYDLRSLIGGGLSKFLVESAWKLFTLNLGAVYNRETVTDDPKINESAEALIGVAFRRFKRGSDSPGVQLGLTTFTNMTDTPRFRAVLNFNVGWQIVSNFNFSFQVNNSYDSDPPGTDSSYNDLTLVTSFGYTF